MNSNGIDFERYDTNLGIEYSSYASEKLGRDLWVVKRSFNYWLDDDQIQCVSVPAGYLTDGASVPRLLWGVVPPWGKYGQAAVMHDWLCEYLRIWDGSKWESITREQCDKLFLEGMETLGVGKILRVSMYAAVTVYSHLNSIVHQSFDSAKHEVEKELLAHYQQTGVWM